jgi:hypothetical protein
MEPGYLSDGPEYGCYARKVRPAPPLFPPPGIDVLVSSRLTEDIQRQDVVCEEDIDVSLPTSALPDDADVQKLLGFIPFSSVRKSRSKRSLSDGGATRFIECEETDIHAYGRRICETQCGSCPEIASEHPLPQVRLPPTPGIDVLVGSSLTEDIQRQHVVCEEDIDVSWPASALPNDADVQKLLGFVPFSSVRKSSSKRPLSHGDATPFIALEETDTHAYGRRICNTPCGSCPEFASERPLPQVRLPEDILADVRRKKAQRSGEVGVCASQFVTSSLPVPSGSSPLYEGSVVQGILTARNGVLCLDQRTPAIVEGPSLV